MPFSERVIGAEQDALPMREVEYVEPVNSAARAILRGKRRRMDPELAPILDRLKVTPRTVDRGQQHVQISISRRELEIFVDSVA